MAGRLPKSKKNKPIDPINKAVADEWMETIGKEYDTIKNACRINSLKKGREWNEDVFQNTIVLCYDSICRNNLRDRTSQGCRNYLFNAYNMNIIHEKITPYNSRKVEDEAILNNHNPPDDCEAQEKVRMQLYNDFATLKILELAEANCDTTSFYCFRLKHLLPKMSYRKLVQITNIKNAKARVKSVIDWIKENVTESELIDEYEKTIGDDLLI